MQSIAAKIQLHNGIEMPLLGLGVFLAEGAELAAALECAFAEGYRLIDTAAFYNNEEGVGQGICRSGIPREEIFVTTKVWNEDQGRELTLQAFEKSRARLGLEYIDLYLVHWPVAEKFIETWQALETLYRDGRVRAVGVSNFQIRHLERLKNETALLPAVNQIEFHPLLTQKPLLKYCQQEGIQVQAWAPLARGKLFGNPVLLSVAEKYEKTEAQIILRWVLQHRAAAIPKSVRPAKIRENAQIFDFSLAEADMDALDGLNENYRVGPDPDTFV